MAALVTELEYPPVVAKTSERLWVQPSALNITAPFQLSVSPPLPTPLFLCKHTHSIVGTPTAPWSRTHTISVLDSDFVVNVSITITLGKPVIAYPTVVRPSNLPLLPVGRPLSLRPAPCLWRVSASPRATGQSGTADSWSIKPNPSATGLAINR